ncbi:hypothetical protein [Celeribacter sp. PS-C1]|uniref:hypothetical protein n=1 Tax=Celeribacter sp. PS-C1 TaxID=2820813 RepID=UPI001CA473FA|nr:hypothetical protein [Celeribacter sp. PS-C1]MBW6417947.1 hypothetical protein [Celeribacter sp. PS-C1]
MVDAALDWNGMLITFLALLGGVIVYLFQKRADRTEQIRSLKREIYAEYLSSVQKYRLRVYRTDKPSARHEAVEEYFSAQYRVMCFAPRSVAEDTRKFSLAFREYIELLRARYEETWRKRLTKEQSAEGYFVRAEERYAETLTSLVNSMRADALGADEAIGDLGDLVTEHIRGQK